MHTSPTCSPRQNWIDYGKGLSIFLVYLNHAEVYIGGESRWSFLFAAFRMPFFFFLSGYLYTSCMQRFDARRKLKQIFRSILIPYLIFTTLLLSAKAFAYGWSPEYVVRQILLGWASWFVIALGVAQLLYIPILHYFKRSVPLFLLSVLLLAAGYTVVQVYPRQLPYCLNSALIAAFFLGLGIQFRMHEHVLLPYLDKTAWWKIGLPYFIIIAIDHYTLGTYGTIGGNSYGNFPLYLLYAVTGIGIMTGLCRQVAMGHAIRYIGRHSLVFYYLNGSFLLLVSKLFHHCGADTGNYAVVLIGSLIGCLLTFPAVWFIDRHFPLATGNKDAFNRLSRTLHLGIRW